MTNLPRHLVANSRRALGVGFLVSITLHAAVGFGFRSWTPAGPAKNPPAAPDDAIELALEPDPEPEIRPGLEESEVDSPTWMGVSQDASPHEAPQGTVEQAAFELAAPAPLADLLEHSEPVPLAQTPAPAPAPRDSLEPIADLVADLARAAETMLAQLAAAAAEVSASAPPSPPEEQTAPVVEAAPAPSPQPAKPLPPGAIVSDRESDAQSKSEPLEVRPGRPLAGAGLDIRTVRPVWPVTVTLMAVPRNPVLDITFGPGGKVLRAVFVDGQGSGYADVDGPLLDAVYRWTATGKALAELPVRDPQPGVTLRIRIILRG